MARTFPEFTETSKRRNLKNKKPQKMIVKLPHYSFRNHNNQDISKIHKITHTQRKKRVRGAIKNVLKSFLLLSRELFIYLEPP